MYQRHMFMYTCIAIEFIYVYGTAYHGNIKKAKSRCKRIEKCQRKQHVRCKDIIPANKENGLHWKKLLLKSEGLVTLLLSKTKYVTGHIIMFS